MEKIEKVTHLKEKNKMLEEELYKSFQREESYRIRLMIVIGVYVFSVLIQVLFNIFG